MSFQKFKYVTKQRLSRYLSSRFANNRSFTVLQTVIKTLKANHLLPETLIALEVFGFIGTSTSLDYAHLTEYLELWEYDPYYAKYAQKINPRATVMCGDSIAALAKGKVRRKDYNFVVIDPNIASGSESSGYESFTCFENALKYTADKAIVIVTIYNDLNAFASYYNTTADKLDANWMKARREFYGLENVVNAPGTDYLKAFEQIIKRNNKQIRYSQFFSRNDSVGFGVFAIESFI